MVFPAPRAFTFLACLIMVHAQSNIPSVKLDIPFKITPTDYITSHSIQPYAVMGAKDCGGISKVNQFTHNGCKKTSTVSCALEIDRHSQASLYFVARENTKDAVIRISLIKSDGQTKSVELPVPNISLQAGQPYVAQVNGTIEEALTGKLFTGRVEVLRDADKSVQACSEVDFLGYKP